MSGRARFTALPRSWCFRSRSRDDPSGIGRMWPRGAESRPFPARFPRRSGHFQPQLQLRGRARIMRRGVPDGRGRSPTRRSMPSSATSTPMTIVTTRRARPIGSPVDRSPPSAMMPTGRGCEHKSTGRSANVVSKTNIQRAGGRPCRPAMRPPDVSRCPCRPRNPPAFATPRLTPQQICSIFESIILDMYFSSHGVIE